MTVTIIVAAFLLHLLLIAFEFTAYSAENELPGSGSDSAQSLIVPAATCTPDVALGSVQSPAVS